MIDNIIAGIMKPTQLPPYREQKQSLIPTIDLQKLLMFYYG